MTRVRHQICVLDHGESTKVSETPLIAPPHDNSVVKSFDFFLLEAVAVAVGRWAISQRLVVASSSWKAKVFLDDR